MDIRPLGFNGDEVAFCRHITVEAKVIAVPVSAFYLTGGTAHVVRFCFSITGNVLDEAIARLEKLFGA